MCDEFKLRFGSPRSDPKPKLYGECVGLEVKGS